MNDTAFWQLTNEERRCFGIAPVGEDWVLRRLPRSRYHDFDIYYYLDGQRVRYAIMHGETRHQEFAMDETLSGDGVYILPKRATKTIPLTAAPLVKRRGVGMQLDWYMHDGSGSVELINATTHQRFLSTGSSGETVDSHEAFRAWIARWQAETTAAEQAEIDAFAARAPQTVKHREGDFFRFRWSRREWGYGRILLDYDLMRRRKIPFYECMMCKPVVVQLLKCVTEDGALQVERLLELEPLIAFNMMDDVLHNGEYEIVGNAPLPENVDALCPIMYGLGPAHDGVLRFQQGRIYRELPGGNPLGARSYVNGSVGWYPHITLPQMRRYLTQPGCGTYWTDEPWRWRKEEDLRNPAYAEELKMIRRQMGCE